MLAFLNSVPSELFTLLPEIFLTIGILLAMVAELAIQTRPRLVTVLCKFVLLCGLILSLLPSTIPLAAPDAMFAPDLFTQFVRIFSFAGGLLTLGALSGSKSLSGGVVRGETSILILSVVLGAQLFASANNLVSLLIGLEFLSLASYGLAGFRAKDPRASEAGLRYVLYGGIASAIAFFGASHLFGMTGSLDLRQIGQTLFMGPLEPALLVPVLLLSVACAFKLSLFPFHFWSPDVYEGCPTLSAGFLSTVPKAAGLAALLHTLQTLFPSWRQNGQESIGAFLAVFGAISVIVGAVTAAVQTDAKRLLAFSSIANAGIFLLALAAGAHPASLAALGFALAAYLAGNLGAFIALDRIQPGPHASRIVDLKGAWRRNPGAVVALTICLFSLAGIPPLAGFTAKWSILRELMVASLGYAGNLPLLAVVVVLIASVILVTAYLRIIHAAAVSEPCDQTEIEEHVDWRHPHLSDVSLAMCVLACIALGFGWPVLSWFQMLLASM